MYKRYLVQYSPLFGGKTLAAGASLSWPSAAVTMVGVAFATVVLGHQTLQYFAEKRRA